MGEVSARLKKCPPKSSFMLMKFTPNRSCASFSYEKAAKYSPWMEGTSAFSGRLTHRLSALSRVSS